MGVSDNIIIIRDGRPSSVRTTCGGTGAVSVNATTNRSVISGVRERQALCNDRGDPRRATRRRTRGINDETPPPVNNASWTVYTHTLHNRPF